MNQGWIKLHRQLTEWEWYNKSEYVHLFIHLLVSANHRDANWQGQTILRGQLITSIGKLSVFTGISEQSIRTILKKLEMTGEIKVKSTNKYTLLTICKYDSYQFEEGETNKQTNKQLTNNQQTTNKQLTTNKNDKNDNNVNNEKNSYSPADFKADLLKLGISEELTTDVMEHRKKCKGLFTKRAFSGLKKELDIFASKENKPYSDALTFLIEQTTWRTFTYEYYSTRTNKPKPITNQKPTNTYGHIKDFGEVQTKW